MSIHVLTQDGGTSDRAEGLRPRVILIVLLARLGMTASSGLIVDGLTAFDHKILQALNVSIAELRLRETVTVFTLGLSVSFIGALVDRFSSRPVISGTSPGRILSALILVETLGARAWIPVDRPRPRSVGQLSVGLRHSGRLDGDPAPVWLPFVAFVLERLKSLWYLHQSDWTHVEKTS